MASASIDQLSAALTRAQAEGALGSAPIPDVIEHARAFVRALPEDVRTVVDLGSGAGIPGLVIALDRPEVAVVLIDRRAKRVDALQRTLAQLGWTNRVRALEAEVESLVADPEWMGGADAVVARGFADPQTTLRLAAPLVRLGGWIIVSEPPADQPSRWDPAWSTQYGLSQPERCGPVVRFHVERSVAG